MATEGALSRGWRLLGECSVVAGLSSVIAVVLYRAWDMSPRVPLRDYGDTRQIQMMVKGIQEHGWWLHNPDLNAPFGQDFHDFSHGGENFQLALVKLLGLFTGNSGITINLYYFAGFALVAVSAYLVCRHLRFSFPVGLVVATLFAFLPYHFWHGPNHLFRSSYWNVPLAVLLLLWALSPWERFTRDGRPPAGWRRSAWKLDRRRVLAALAICVLVGSFETMVAAFTIALLASSGLVVAIAHRQPQRLLVHGVLAAVIAITFVANQAPSLLYAARHGTNEEAGRREVWESELYGLRISSLILPVSDGTTRHRIDLLADLGDETFESPLRSEGGQALGLIGAAGFLAALYRVLVRAVRRDRARDPDEPRGRLWDDLGLLVVLAVLFGAISGFSFVLSVLGTAQIRVWNRIAVLIALCALLVVAIGLERLLRRVRPVAGWALVAVLLALGLFDLTSSQAPDHDAAEGQFVSDRTFVRAIEARLPAGASVFQFPVFRFPEEPPLQALAPYDPMKGYQHSKDLRWSYGGVRGRPRVDWQLALRERPIEQKIEGVAAVGFDGIWLDRFGYEDRGEDFEATLAETLGTGPTLISSDDRFTFWDIRQYRERLERERSDRSLDRLAERLLGEPSPLRKGSG